MKKVSFAAVCAAVMTTPAQAKDASFYTGIEGGLLMPQSQTADATIDYTTTHNIDYVALGLDFIPPPPADTIAQNALRADWKHGYEIGAFAGYDFGNVRLEVELAQRQAKQESFKLSSDLLSGLNANLNRPPCCGVTISSSDEPPLTEKALEGPGDRIALFSAMFNALAEIGTDDFTAYAGGGFGAVRAKALGDEDRSWAWQFIAGARRAISSRIDLGIKYRFFQTGVLSFAGEPVVYSGNRRSFAVVIIRPTSIGRETSAALTPKIHEKFQSHSLLATVSYNFGRP